MTRTIKADFYQVSISQAGDLTFGEILEQVSKLNVKNRVIHINEVPMWLHEFNPQEQYIGGDIICSRMYNLPMKAKLSGDIKDLNLASDEGIGEQTAFFYHRSTKLLILQRVQGGANPGRFANYFQKLFESITDFSGSIIILPLLETDVMKQLDNLKNVRKFIYKIARPENLEMFGNKKSTVQEILRMDSEFDSSDIEVIYSSGRKKDSSLSVQKVRDTINSLFNLQAYDSTIVKKITISGKLENHKSGERELATSF